MFSPKQSSSFIKCVNAPDGSTLKTQQDLWGPISSEHAVRAADRMAAGEGGAYSGSESSARRSSRESSRERRAGVKNRALNERLSQAVCPPLLSLQGEGDQRERKSRAREGREREARQALLIHRLQNKVLEYRGRCKHLDDQLQDEHTQLIHTQLRIRDEHNDSLESALIRLEEEQQRSGGLAETNALLREQLGQSEQAKEALREDLQKLTTDWRRAVEEAGKERMIG
ncbi:hypothetical protein CgunFtcFv8_024085 [Champsocephalus gunnari]|uniref:Rootletin-like coiled-coil domain-containing protein n=1 Tax=Champsocephalus gunnari TaxID=52237 RepID=A0AAN8HM37_CHAGU|nr:hypothetical protein CgunFtcFv8_024085 [Champsocephalus gunnari]